MSKLAFYALFGTVIFSTFGIVESSDLRILPVGDSITKGARSSDDNGYRLDLHNLLASSGYSNYIIGQLRNGNNFPANDNFHSGWAGRTISKISNLTAAIYPKNPNIVLLHAGTNDLNRSPPAEPYDSAPDRLASLMDGILTIADTTLFVAQIIMTANDDSNSRIADFNAVIPTIVSQRVNQGYKVIAVDMSAIGGANSGDISDDGIHPTDQGYSKIANAWFGAISQASQNGLIAPPNPPSSK